MLSFIIGVLYTISGFSILCSLVVVKYSDALRYKIRAVNTIVVAVMLTYGLFTITRGNNMPLVIGLALSVTFSLLSERLIDKFCNRV